MELIDHLGAAVFALSGVLAVADRRLDWFGAIVVGVVTAVGGGTMRGLVLGVTPVFWVEDQSYLILAVAGAVIAIGMVSAGHPGPGRVDNVLKFADGAGLSLFAYAGAAIALGEGYGGPLAVAMGVLTAVGGGVIRDVLADRTPLVLRGEVYATAALAGAGVYVLLAEPLGIAEAVAAVASMATTFTLRMLGMYRGWSLPSLARRV